MSEDKFPTSDHLYLYNYDIDDQFRCFVHKISMDAIKASELERASVSSAQEADIRKENIRRAFLSAIGGLPEDSPLNPVVV